jgi:hypothetical protein
LQSRSLSIGDPILVDVKGEVFSATVRTLPGRDEGKRLVGIDPDNPRRFTRRFCSPRCIRERLEVAS